MALAKQGDTAAFAELIQRYQKPVVHFTQRFVGSREDAEDIAQESFVRIHRYLHRLVPQAKFSTLLFGISRNLALNHLRDSGRRGRGVTFSLTDADRQDIPLQDESLRPDRLARLNEIERRVHEGIMTLSPKHREVLVLRELQGFDYATIAEIVKCRKGTVKSRIARAREQLRIVLEEGGSAEL